MKKALVFVLAFLLSCSFIMTGCSKKTSADQSLKKVMDKKEFVLGLDASFPPMGYRDENNEIVGFDIDVAREVCKRLGITLKPQPISWEAKEQELNSGNIDCIWNGLSIDEKRAAAMNLSDPYMKNRMVLVVTNASGLTRLTDFNGKKVAVQNGSTAQTILQDSELAKSLGSIITFDDNLTAFMDLDKNGVDAVFLDEVVANDFITRQKKDYKVLDEGLYEEEYAIGFRKADQLLRDKVQSVLHEMKEDGKLAEISTKWFGKDVTIVK